MVRRPVDERQPRRVPQDLRRHRARHADRRAARRASPASSCSTSPPTASSTARSAGLPSNHLRGRTQPRRDGGGGVRRASSRESTRRRRAATTSASASWSRPCATPTAGSRSPSSPCATATTASSASTSPAPRLGFPAVAVHRAPSTTSPRTTSRSPCTRARPTASTSIESALFDGRALRLGHGVRLAEDITITSEDDENSYVALGPVAQWVKDREITLEICPVSNLFTNADRHDRARRPPLRPALPARLPRDGEPRQPPHDRHDASARSSRCSSTTFGYDLIDLEVFQQNAAASAFLSIDDREELADRIIGRLRARPRWLSLPLPAEAIVLARRRRGLARGRAARGRGARALRCGQAAATPTR